MSKYLKCPDCKKLSSLETVFPVPGGLECPHCGVGIAAPLWVDAAKIGERDEQLSRLQARFGHACLMCDTAESDADHAHWSAEMQEAHDELLKFEAENG